LNLPFELFLLSVVFFGFMAVVNAVHAYRKKEKAYYLGAMISVLMFLTAVFIILDQVIIVLLLIVATAIFSVAALPKTMKAARQEMVKQLQEVDVSAPLEVRDFFTNKGWFKLVSKWGLWKTMSLFYILSVAIIGGIFLILTTFYDFITIEYVVCYTATVSILVTFIFHQQLKKALKERMKEAR